MARPEAKGERSLGLFALGLLILNPPLLSIFSVETSFFGLPLLYLYLFGVWAMLIVLMALIARSPGRRERLSLQDRGGEGA